MPNYTSGLPLIRNRGGELCFGSDATFVVHSGQLLDVALLKVTRPGDPRDAESFHYEVAAEGLPVRHGEATLAPFPLEDTAEATRGEG